MTYTPPSRGSGTTVGWVAPSVVQDGIYMRSASTGLLLLVEGVSNGDAGTDPDEQFTNPNSYGLTLLLHANRVDAHVHWDKIEPTRPQGGDPVAGAGHGETRDFSGGGILVGLEALATYCDANGIYLSLHLVTSNMGPYFGASTGVPAWLYDSSLWGGGDVSNHTAPLPSDRAGYGGDYPTNGVQDARTAYLARGTTTIKSVTGPTPGIVWHGDSTKLDGYRKPLILALQTVMSRHASAFATLPYNEPQLGDLANSANMGNAVKGTEEMLRAQKPVMDYIHTLDPQRAVCYMGVSSTSWQTSPDFSLLWTSGAETAPAGTAGVGYPCPASHAMMKEWHCYTSGQAAPLDPFDGYASTDPQTNVADPNTYAPFRDGSGTPTYIAQAFAAMAAEAAKEGVPLSLGEYGIGTGVTNYALYIQHMVTYARLYNMHCCYFNVGVSVKRGLSTKTGVDGSGHNTYTLNQTTGPALAAQLAIPHTVVVPVPYSPLVLRGPEGSPNGSLAAPVGTLVVSADGVIYRKSSGTGTAGWKAMNG